MTDKVKLIIEIDPNITYAIQNNKGVTLGNQIDICNAIKNGKPLSENKGEWITDETSGSALNDRYYCSNCGKELKMPYTVIKAEQKNGKYLFCDRCGADMRGE